jgi:deazaflavin-dependent oxidoreductase (nitroreductase family)
MPNDVMPAPTKISARIGAQAAGALAVGAIAVGTLAIGALAIGRLMIGRARIRRLEIDELVVGRLYVRETITAPSAPMTDENRPRKQSARFNRPTIFDRFINKVFGLLVGVGLGLRHNYLLQVRGRKSGRIYSTPINVLDRDGKRYLVAARGYTEWVRNAVASGTISLQKGRWSQEFDVRLVSDDEKPEILKSYLDRYRLTVQRYFLLPARSPAEAFLPFTRDYPVFELISRVVPAGNEREKSQQEKTKKA